MIKKILLFSATAILSTIIIASLSYYNTMQYNNNLAYDINLGEYTKGIDIPEGVTVKLLKDTPRMRFWFNKRYDGIYDPITDTIYVNLNGSNLDEARDTIKHELYHWEYGKNMSKEEKQEIKKVWESFCYEPTEFYARIMNGELAINRSK